MFYAKKIMLSLSLLISPALIMSIQPDFYIRPLSEQRIAIEQAKLGKKLAVHAKLRGALVVAGVGMTGLSMYKMLREFFTVTNIFTLPSQNAQAVPVEPKPWQDKAITFAKGVGIFVAESAGAIVVNGVLAHLVGKVMHDGSLTWWLTTHAPYQQTVELMEEVALQYAHALNAQDAERHQKRFVTAANALMVQCEQIIAFMRYKASMGTAHAKTLKHEVQEIAAERIHALSVQLHAAISANDAHALAGILKQFKAEFNQDLIRFAYNDQ